MLKKLTLPLILIAALGCNSPNVVGTNAYYDRVQRVETEIQERVARKESILVFRTTARVVRLSVLSRNGSESTEQPGPLVCIYDARPGEIYSLLALWQDSYESREYHKHTIEYWNQGRLVATKSADGSGAFTVSIRI
jgi:hypothetical protein